MFLQKNIILFAIRKTIVSEKKHIYSEINALFQVGQDVVTRPA